MTTVNIKLLGRSGNAHDDETRTALPIVRGDVSSDELKRWANLGRAGGEMPEAQRLVGLLHARRILSFMIYGPYKSRESRLEWREQSEFCRYFKSVMNLSRTLDNFWGFRQRLPSGEGASSSPDLNLIGPPPWTVTAWNPEVKVESWSELEKAPTPLNPAAWSAFEVPPVYPALEENIFASRLALSHQYMHRRQHIKGLSKAYGGDIDVEVHENPHSPNLFLADIYSDIRNAELRRHMPLPPGQMVKGAL